MDDVMTFTDGIDSYKIYGKPTTTEVMLGNGVLDDATGTAPNTPKHDKQLQLQAQICAALNRHVAEQPNERWYNADYFFPVKQTGQFLHEVLAPAQLQRAGVWLLV
ncbi:beta-1,3-glucanase family protein [Massilia sp. H-1]|nr:beta-1,3-glucanase family protein [Massilia sp. H-1]